MSDPSASGRRPGPSFVLEPETYAIPTLVLRDLDVDALDAFIAQQLKGSRAPFSVVEAAIAMIRRSFALR